MKRDVTTETESTEQPPAEPEGTDARGNGQPPDVRYASDEQFKKG